MSKNKKIGIVTQWESSDNYGQQLQCWALQYCLKQKGLEPYLIRYTPAFVPSSPPSPFYIRLLKAILIVPAVMRLLEIHRYKKQFKLIAENRRLSKMREFQQFREKYLSLSPVVYHGLNELQKNPPEADTYIVGSDQVWWFPLDKKEHEVWYLNFGKEDVIRASYAASFGMDSYPEELKDKLKTQLAKFNCISVREETGRKICEEVGYDAVHVVDPTLLLNREDYDSVFDITKKESQEILIYSLNYSSKKDIPWNEIKKFVKHQSYKVKVITASGYIPARELFEGVDYEYATIPQWIEAIANSQLVIASSFHGIVFSIIYHTNFVYVPIKGEHARGNSRVWELLHDLGLENMIWDEQKHMRYYINERIDWTIIDEKLKLKRQSSIDYINKSLTI